VDLIGPRFRDQIDGRAAVLAEHSRERLRLNLEFRYSIRRRLNGEASGKHVLRVYAVNQHVVPGTAQSPAPYSVAIRRPEGAPPDDRLSKDQGPNYRFS